MEKRNHRPVARDTRGDGEEDVPALAGRGHRHAAHRRRRRRGGANTRRRAATAPPPRRRLPLQLTPSSKIDPSARLYSSVAFAVAGFSYFSLV